MDILLFRAVIAVSGVVCLGAQTPTSLGPNGLACRVVEAYVDEILATAQQEIVFSDSPFRAPPQGRSTAWIRSAAGWSDRPSKDISARYAEAGPSSPFFHCPDLRSRVERGGAKVGEAAIEAATAKGADQRPRASYDAMIVTLASPVVSEDGREALVDEAIGCGSLCGRSMILHFRLRENGRWEVTDRLLIGLS